MTDDAAPVLEQEPAAAVTLFGDRIELARSFTGELARRGEELGLIGPLELPRLWTRHILNSALLAPLLQANGRVADVGSGAGLPGLVLAIARPDVSFTLIEPMERRCDWLNAEADRLGLENVTVLRAARRTSPTPSSSTRSRRERSARSRSSSRSRCRWCGPAGSSS